MVVDWKTVFSAMSSAEELTNKLALLDEENARLKGVLDSSVALIHKEYSEKLDKIEFENAERDKHLRAEIKRLLAERETWSEQKDAVERQLQASQKVCCL